MVTRWKVGGKWIVEGTPEGDRFTRTYTVWWKWGHAEAIRSAINPEFFPPRPLGDEHTRLMNLDAPDDLNTGNLRIRVFMALVYVTYEAYSRIDKKDLAIRALATRDRIGELKEFRHAMFHKQKDFIKDERDFNYSIHDETRQWVIDLHREIGRFMWRNHRDLCDEPTQKLFEQAAAHR